MKLYEIKEEYDRALFDAIDPDTGEVSQELAEKLDSIEDDFDTKAVSVACMVKNYKASASAIGEEIKKLQARKSALDNHSARLKEYLAHNLDGKKLDDPRASISWRKSEAVNILDMGSVPADYTKQADPTADKTLIKKAIKDGFAVPGAELETRSNIVIK